MIDKSLSVLSFIQNLFKPNKDRHEMKMEFFKLRNLLLLPIKNIRGVLISPINKYRDCSDYTNISQYTVSSSLAIRCNFDDNCLTSGYLSYKLSIKQLEFLLNFFRKIADLNKSYNNINEKAIKIKKDTSINKIMDEIELSAFDNGIINLTAEEASPIIEQLDFHLFRCCSFLDDYLQTNEDMFLSILKLIDKVTKFNSSDQDSLVNEFKTTVNTYKKIKGTAEYLVL